MVAIIVFIITPIKFTVFYMVCALLSVISTSCEFASTYLLHCLKFKCWRGFYFATTSSNKWCDSKLESDNVIFSNANWRRFLGGNKIESSFMNKRSENNAPITPPIETANIHAQCVSYTE